jgi:hypothetical protein
MLSRGRSTCASVSAFSFDAQPAQLDRLVSRIFLPEVDRFSSVMAQLYMQWLNFLVISGGVHRLK